MPSGIVQPHGILIVLAVETWCCKVNERESWIVVHLSATVMERCLKLESIPS